MPKKLSISLIRPFAKGIIDFLHHKPAADVEFRKAETEDKRADAKLKEAKSNYINAKAQQARLQKYFLLDQLMEKIEIPKEQRRNIILREGSKCQKALEEILSFHERGRILSVQLKDEEIRQLEVEDHS